MFKPVTSKVNFPELEGAILQWWKDEDIFHRTEKERDGGPLFMLFEGPPTANGSPGIHHVLARVFKDIICRYKTMKGYHCLRKGGWDTHGLPVELEVERELGLTTKRDIETYGIERFNQSCRDSVFRYVKEWESMTDRIGFWVDMEHPYITLENSYIETGWWIIKELWDKGLVYQGMKGTPHCPRCVTSLSSHEVALGYQENTPDPSVYIKFRLSDWDRTRGIRKAYDALSRHGGPIYFLAWTTTPWTLPGNTALAVDPSAEYSLVEVDAPEGKGKLLLASALVDEVIHEPHSLVDTFYGRDLVALSYKELYDPRDYATPIGQFRSQGEASTDDTPGLEEVETFTPRIIGTTFVSLEDGTGIVHIAPAFGDEDLNEGINQELAFVQPVDLQGKVTGTYPFAGKFVKDADEEIMADLKERGLLYRREVYHHTYPFCWRCDTPLLYYAKSSWYIRTSAMKERLISGNAEINWYPDYIKEGRFGEWLRNNVDWAISRERYWGTPLPIWQCDSCNQYHCVGSVAELKEMALEENKSQIDHLDLHRPYVDTILIQCPHCGGTMKRIPEVMDAWFDSGAMPYAQWHYPFENQDIVEDGRFPADYICEAVDQTRGWFYSLHALSTLLTNKPSYRNVICLGLILDEKGQKMSKHLGNVVEPSTVLDHQGTDATRWYLFTASQPGEPRRFSPNLVNEVVRRFLLTLWNVYSFFITYASLDNFHPNQIPPRWQPTSELDRWMMSELNSLVSQVDQYMDTYNPTDAGRRIQELVDRMSNWYVRRSRRRFWKSESDENKLSAYATLYTCLVTLSKLLAPFTPFLAEEMYRNLVASVDPQAPESVHLASFPQADEALIEPSLMEATRLAVRISSLGRAARSRAGIKVRQPLPAIRIKLRQPEEEKAIQKVAEQVMDELNVKKLDLLASETSLYQQAMTSAEGKGETIFPMDDHWVAIEGGYLAALDTSISTELASEGLARELVHRIQNMRRSALFELTDHITTYYHGPSRIRQVMESYADYIQQETLSKGLVEGTAVEGSYIENQKVEGMEIALGVSRG